MPMRSIFHTLSFASLAFALAACDTAETRNNLAKPSLNATGIAKANAAKIAQTQQAAERAVKLAALEKSVNCTVQLKSPGFNLDENGPGEVVSGGRPKNFRLSGADDSHEEELLKNESFRVTLLSGKGRMHLLIMDVVANKKIAEARTSLSSKSITLSQEISGTTISASCQEDGDPRTDPALDRSGQWKCVGLLNSEDPKVKPIPFSFDAGAPPLAKGPEGVPLAELALAHDKNGGPISIGLRKPGAATSTAEASADDKAGQLVLDGALPADTKLSAHVQCKRGDGDEPAEGQGGHLGAGRHRQQAKP